jgi:5'(3')-deoxyribonucleotidase
MKIGIDLDDVVVDFSRPFCEFYNQRNGTNFQYEEWTKYHFADSFGLDKKLVNALAEEFINNGASHSLHFIEGAKEGIQALFRLNYEPCIVTSRPLRWNELTNNFFKRELPKTPIKIFYSDEISKDHAFGKASICARENIKVIIEDNAEYALACLNACAQPILLNQTWNQGEFAGIIRARDWKEILEKIGEMGK